MEDEEKDHQFLLQSRERQEKLRGIIAVMGLPLTFKTFLADFIGYWAKSPALCVQNFTDSCDMKAAVDAVEQEDAPVADERRRQLLVQRAFPRLLKVAKFHLSLGSSFRGGNSTVVIKSRLKSTFELDRLFELLFNRHIIGTGKTSCPLLIIDCRDTNVFRWKNYLEESIEGGGDAPDIEDDEVLRSWYRPASWIEMEDLIAWYGDDYQATWDLHLQQLLLKASDHAPPLVVRRLVLDPMRDSAFNFADACISSILGDAIKYLLTTPQQELTHVFPNPCAVEYRELRPYLLEKRWSAAELRGRRNYLCPGNGCVFKFSKALASSNLTYNCGACAEQVVSGTPAYTCRLCTLTLHKACAERVDFKALVLFVEAVTFYNYIRRHLPQKYACGSCVDAGKDFNDNCESCLFQTHLKCGPLPTIINHDSHPHFLSLYLIPNGYQCRACGKDGVDFSYRCMQCASFYHWRCAFLPLELLKHKHGGHEHVMKLMYSLHEDGMEKEETYWCEVCYNDIDPEACCYLCQTCPYYVTEVECACGFEFLQNPKDVRLVQQLQPQLEDAFPKIFKSSVTEST